jgi:hypothetical protein
MCIGYFLLFSHRHQIQNEIRINVNIFRGVKMKEIEREREKEREKERTNYLRLEEPHYYLKLKEQLLQHKQNEITIRTNIS